MGRLVEAASKIAGEASQMKPGQELVLEVSGYDLCQGSAGVFLKQQLEILGLNYEDFSFEWDNTEAQFNDDALLPLTVVRVVAGD